MARSLLPQNRILPSFGRLCAVSMVASEICCKVKGSPILYHLLKLFDVNGVYTTACLFDGVIALSPKIITDWNPSSTVAKIPYSSPLKVGGGRRRFWNTSVNPEQNVMRTSRLMFSESL